MVVVFFWGGVALANCRCSGVAMVSRSGVNDFFYDICEKNDPNFRKISAVFKDDFLLHMIQN